MAFQLKRNLIILSVFTAIIILLTLSILQMHWINTLVIDQAVNRVKQKINCAWQILDDQKKKLSIVADLLSKVDVVSEVQNSSIEKRLNLLQNVKTKEALDVLTLVFPGQLKDNTIANYLVKRFALLVENGPLDGFADISKEILKKAAPEIREKVTINNKIENSIFIFSLCKKQSYDKKTEYYIVAAKCLSNDVSLIDRIQTDLFKDKFYKGKRVGTVTIFCGPQRIATTVLLKNGHRATGTLVSKEVEAKVLNNGIPWIGRAFVVSDWYLSRYEPIVNPGGHIIGMLYIGELEQLYTDQKYNIVFTGAGVLFFIIVLAFLVGALMINHARKIEQAQKEARFDFIRVLGHELKSPINSIESYLQVMHQGVAGELPEKYRSIVERSILRIQYMRKLIGDLLDLTRIESGHKKRALVEVDIVKTAREVIEDEKANAEKKQVIIKLNATNTIKLYADESEIHMILSLEEG